MPELVVTVQRGGDDRDLLDVIADLGPGKEARSSVNEIGDASATRDLLVALRDELGLTDKIRYHVCGHAENDGNCTGLVTEY